MTYYRFQATSATMNRHTVLDFCNGFGGTTGVFSRMLRAWVKGGI